MHRRLSAFLGCSVALVAGALAALPLAAQPTAALVRIVDVGNGLCAIAHMPDGFDLLYDAGHWESSQCKAAVDELVTDGVIDLIVISHSDGDHLGELKAILESGKTVKQLVHSGSPGTSNAWRNAMTAIEKLPKATKVVSLADLQRTNKTKLPPPVVSGDTTVTFVSGYGTWDPRWSDDDARPTASELRNVISVVVRLDYRGHSILFTGDTIGRRLGDLDTACRDAENRMINGKVPLKADVLLAPHHGGNNGSSACFIQAVKPEFVIFPAGRDHEHPTKAAAERYLAAGVAPAKLFRTDRGDHEEGQYEWAEGRRSGCEDGRGDDDIEIRLPNSSSGRVAVAYRTADGPCL